MHELVREYKALLKCSVDFFMKAYHSDVWYNTFSRKQDDEMVDELVVVYRSPELKQYLVKNNPKVFILLAGMLRKINISFSEMEKAQLNIFLNTKEKKITHQIIPPVCKDNFTIEYVFSFNNIDDIKNCCELLVSAKIKYRTSVMKPIAIFAKKKIKKYVLGDVPKNILQLATEYNTLKN